MTNYYIPIIYIVPLISVDGQVSPRLFIAPEIRHEKISYTHTDVSSAKFFWMDFTAENKIFTTCMAGS